MVGRMLRALVRRAEEGDTEALEQLARLEVAAAHATTEAMVAMYTGSGPRYSYGEVANILGVSRQAVRQRVVRGMARGPHWRMVRAPGLFVSRHSPGGTF